MALPRLLGQGQVAPKLLVGLAWKINFEGMVGSTALRLMRLSSQLRLGLSSSIYRVVRL